MKNYVIISNKAEEVQVLQNYLQHIPGAQVVATFPNAENKTLDVAQLDCDVILGTLSLIDRPALTELKRKYPAAYIITLGNQQQIEDSKMETDVFAFLQSPFSFERMISLVNNINVAANVLTEKKDYIFIKSEYKLIKINLSDILYITGMKDYTQVFLKGKSSPLTTLQNLKEFEQKLPLYEFIRVHRSYIISLAHVECIARNEVSINGQHIPIGDAYRHQLETIIQKNS